MDKIKELISKFGNYICIFAAAYFLVYGLLNVDILRHMFDLIGLGFIVRIAYIVVGLVGLYKVLEIFKPDLIEKLDDLNKKK